MSATFNLDDSVKQGQLPALVSRQFLFCRRHFRSQPAGRRLRHAGHAQCAGLQETIAAAQLNGPLRFFFFQQSPAAAPVLNPAGHGIVALDRNRRNLERRIRLFKLLFHDMRNCFVFSHACMCGRFFGRCSCLHKPASAEQQANRRKQGEFEFFHLSLLSLNLFRARQQTARLWLLGEQAGKRPSCLKIREREKAVRAREAAVLRQAQLEPLQWIAAHAPEGTVLKIKICWQVRGRQPLRTKGSPCRLTL